MGKDLPEEISFGEWVHQRRRLLDLTQQELADQVGCARITLRRIESGALKPSKELALILLDKLGAPQTEREAWQRFARGLSGVPGPPSDSPTSKPRTNFPTALTSFIGREKEREEVVQLLKSNRLVTLTGTGGIGKTRLAIQTASALLSEFPDGTWLVELAPLSDPALVPQVMVATLGLIEQANRPPQTILTDFLKAKRSLLILDNCEHLIQAGAQLVEALLQACPDLHILATSREALGVSGEWIHNVATLSIPDLQQPLTTASLTEHEAVQLFLDRAQTAAHNFEFTPENAIAIAQICHHLDGIPLALELAAARLRGLSVEQIASRLNDRFHLLTSGARTVLPRHQTLQALIDWSHDLLTDPERILLRRLSIFAGGWTLEAAEAVCAGNGLATSQILDLLLHLVDKSLVVAETHDTESRYHMLETIRQYARERLWAAGEGDTLRQRHLAYFVDLAERAEANLRSRRMVEWLDRLEAELDDNRVALDWAQESDVETQLRLASSLLWFWHIRGHKNEGIDWLERGLSIEAMERGDQPLTPSRAMIRGKALNATGYLMAVTFMEEKATARLEESLALFQELGLAGQRGIAHALLRLGGLASDGIQGRSMLERSLILCRENDDKFGIAECLTLLVGSAQNDDDYEQAVVLAEEQLALRREIGDLDGIATALGDLGSLCFFVQNDYHQAVTLLEESLAGFRTVGNKWAIGFYLSNYGDVCLWQGDFKRATRIYKEAIAFAQNTDERLLIAANSYSLGVVAWFRGDFARATKMITDSLAVFRDIGFHWLIANSLHALGGIALTQGDSEGAAQWYETELAFGRETQLNEIIIFALDGLGQSAWSQGNYELAEERFEKELSMSRDTDIKPAMCRALYGFGRVAQSRGDYVAARELYVEIFKIQRRRISFLFNWAWLKTYGSAIAYPIEAFAVLATAQNQMQRAARLLCAAETLYVPLRFEMSAKERVEHDQAIAAARAALGEEVFAAAWEEGKKMSLEEAVAYALEEV